MTDVPVSTRPAPSTVAPVAADEPFYIPVHNEVQVFRAAWNRELPIMLKGPTGCGKTRLVEYMSHLLGRPLHTVSCHEDLTSADLVGRYVITGGDTVWQDGPLTRAVREGGICYLDEIVEARQDSTVAIHSLADHRRELTLERQGGATLKAAPGFSLVVSYNPGYQSVLKDLKMSTRQRMVSIELGFPSAELERSIVVHESGVDQDTADALVRLGQAIRQLAGQGLKEVASTRTLVAAGALIADGLPVTDAAFAAIAGPLTDDTRLQAGLVQMIQIYLGR